MWISVLGSKQSYGFAMQADVPIFITCLSSGKAMKLHNLLYMHSAQSQDCLVSRIHSTCHAAFLLPPGPGFPAFASAACALQGLDIQLHYTDTHCQATLAHIMDRDAQP